MPHVHHSKVTNKPFIGILYDYDGANFRMNPQIHAFDEYFEGIDFGHACITSETAAMAVLWSKEKNDLAEVMIATQEGHIAITHEMPDGFADGLRRFINALSNGRHVINPN